MVYEINEFKMSSVENCVFVLIGPVGAFALFTQFINLTEYQCSDLTIFFFVRLLP